MILLASDQGATLTVNGGETWSSWYNQPTAQFYHVITDNQSVSWKELGESNKEASTQVMLSLMMLPGLIGKICANKDCPFSRHLIYGVLRLRPAPPNWIWDRH